MIISSCFALPVNNAYAEENTNKKMYNLAIFVKFNGQGEYIGNEKIDGYSIKDLLDNSYNNSK